MLACSLVTRTCLKTTRGLICGTFRRLTLEVLSPEKTIALIWKLFKFLMTLLAGLFEMRGCWHMGLKWAIVALQATCFFFLQYSNIKISVTLFSGTVRPRRLKLGALWKMFLSHLSQELWGLEGWKVIPTWTIGGWIVYSFIIFFSRTARDKKLKQYKVTNMKNKYNVLCILKSDLLHIEVRLPVLLCAVMTVEGDFRFCWTITPNVGQTHKENPNLS